MAHTASERFMAVALEAATRGLAAGEPPVGACLVRDDEVITVLNNAVISELDITAHAEIRVIRDACRRLRKLELSDCRLFVTVEPCPMCLGACHYAAISEVVFGARLEDMHALTDGELIPPRTYSPVHQEHNIRMTGDCLRADCRELLEQWAGKFQVR